MAVPARPIEGAPVDVAWGGVAHDTAVAQDIQLGTATVTTAGSPAMGSVTVTFPRPFASAPVVMMSGSGTGTDNMVTGVDNVTATGCRLNLRANSAFAYTVRWLAVGPRS